MVGVPARRKGHAAEAGGRWRAGTGFSFEYPELEEEIQIGATRVLISIELEEIQVEDNIFRSH